MIFIQSEILSNASVTDIGKLESALKRAEQHHHYENIKDIIELTAIYVIGIAKAHAFPDGLGGDFAVDVVWGGVAPGARGGDDVTLENLCRTKTSNLLSLCSPSRTQYVNRPGA
nr:hypothetical protein [Legionella tunisiensis]